MHQRIRIFRFVLVEFDESLGGEPAVLKHFDNLEKILKQYHQEGALVCGWEQVAVDVFDHVVDKFAVVEVAK